MTSKNVIGKHRTIFTFVILSGVHIGDGAIVGARAVVTKDVPPGETWAGFPAKPYRQFARSLYLLDRLEDVWRAFKRLEDR